MEEVWKGPVFTISSDFLVKGDSVHGHNFTDYIHYMCEKLRYDMSEYKIQKGSYGDFLVFIREHGVYE